MQYPYPTAHGKKYLRVKISWIIQKLWHSILRSLKEPANNLNVVMESNIFSEITNILTFAMFE